MLSLQFLDVEQFLTCFPYRCGDLLGSVDWGAILGVLRALFDVIVSKFECICLVNVIVRFIL